RQLGQKSRHVIGNKTLHLRFMFTHITDTPPAPEDHGPSQEPLLATPTQEEREHMTRTQTMGHISFHMHEHQQHGSHHHTHVHHHHAPLPTPEDLVPSQDPLHATPTPE